MGLGKRLLYFIIHCYNSQSYFSKLLKIKESALSRYIQNNSQPNCSMLFKLYEFGLSIDWLFSGNGSMFADNEEGNRLLKQSLIKEHNTYNECVNRITSWIYDNFESIEYFCQFNSIEKNYLENVLYQGAFPDSKFVKLFEDAGCNYKWIYTGIGSKYNTTPTGKILKYKSMGLLHLINYINKYSLVKYDIKNISSRNELFDFLKTAVEIESSNLNINENILINIHDNIN